jgi:phosphatidylserine decarboxylase
LIPDPAIVYAAADGVVVGIDRSARDPWLPEGEALRIRVFLSLHNVHVNRSPVAGRVAAVEKIRGGFAPALLERADANYKNRVVIDGQAGRVVVVQIAGMIARKIACWVQPLETVAAGQRIGLIHFGSRTDVLLAAGSAELFVQLGDRVRAGVTPLARYPAKEATACESL